MKLNKILYFFPLFFLAFCQKEPNISGNATGDNLEKIDSTKFVSYTLEAEARDALNEADVPLGKVVDARFGEVLASVYAQLRLTTNSFEPGANAVLDSIVLVLTIDDVYGPLNNALDIEVYRLTEDIDDDLTYTSDNNLSTDPTIIGSLNSFVYNEEENLRIPMNASFGNELLNLFGSSTTESNSNFLDYLKGIYITVNPTSGGDGHLNLDLTNTSTALKLYFTSDNASDSVYNYLIDEQALSVNKYEIDYTGSELELALNDASNNDENLLLGGFNESKAKIDLPDLSYLQGVVVNQAKLSFFQTDYADAINTGYALPSFLFLSAGKSNDTLQYFLTDYSSSSPTLYGGSIELVEENSITTNSYSYKIPKFIQRVIDQETEMEFLTLEILNYNNGNKVKLGGSIHPTLPMKLEILYTKP